MHMDLLGGEVYQDHGVGILTCGRGNARCTGTSGDTVSDIHDHPSIKSS